MPVVVEIDPAEIEGLALSLEVDRKQMVAAARAATKRAIRWARVQVARGMAMKLNIPQGALSSRVIARAKGDRAQVWIALNPLNIERVPHSKTSTGLRAGRKEYPGAFVARGKYGGRVAMRRKGRSRYPLEAVSIDVLSVAPEQITRKAWPELNERFLSIYEEELRKRAG